jgi:hypothetical protein
MGKASISEYIKQIAGTFDQIISVKVTAVNYPFFDGELITGETLQNIRLVAEEFDKVFVLIPQIDSNAIVGMVDAQNGILLLASDIDEVYLRGTEHGGLVKVSELVDKLNNLENQVNDILTTLKNTTIPLAPSGTYPFAPLYASINNLTPTQISDIENDKVKHG